MMIIRGDVDNYVSAYIKKKPLPEWETWTQCHQDIAVDMIWTFIQSQQKLYEKLCKKGG